MISRRDALVWSASFVIVATIIVATGFTSDDPDSGLHAGIADRMVREPVARWVAPEWWGFWPEAHLTGLYVEHPAGIFWLPAALGRLGIPGIQAAYVVGIGAGLAAVLLIGSLVSRLCSREDARAVLVLLQVMPVAFIFRIRANHEYPMLFALVLTLVGLAVVARSWRGLPLVGFGLTAGLLVKGAFVLLPLAGAGLWILINPTREAGARVRGIIALITGLLVMCGVAALYDAQYVRVTGHSFWTAYLQRQIAPLDIATPVEGRTMLAHNLAFYASRLLWHPAPWSVALVAVCWTQRRRIREFRPLPADTMLRGLVFSLTFAVAAVVILIPSSRFAERYVFSGTYAIGAAGAVVAFHWWAWVRRVIARLDAAIPALPAVTWLVLMLLRLGLGPLLPRI